MVTLTLEEYKNEVCRFWSKVTDELLTDCTVNEIYKVETVFRNDIVAKHNPHACSSVFKTYQSLEEFISYCEYCLDDELEYIDEDAEEFCCWEITKYRLSEDEEYRKIFTLHRRFSGGYMEVYFNILAEGILTADETDIYNDWLRLSGSFSRTRVDIKFPFSKGDILKISGHPYKATDQYYVCCDENGNAISRNYFNKLCTKRIFSHTDIAGYSFFVPCHIEKVNTCDDKALFALHNYLSNPDSGVIEKLIESLNRPIYEKIDEYIKRAAEIEKQISEEDD